MVKKDQLYIILHMPKTGGMTLRKHIENNFNEKEIIKIYPEENPEINKQGLKKYLQNHKNKKTVNIVIGHNISLEIHKYLKRKARYITFVRNPIEIPISTYNFIITYLDKDLRDFSKYTHKIKERIKKKIMKNNKIISFNEVIGKYPGMSNIMIRTILTRFLFEEIFNEKIEEITKKDLEKAKNILDKFYFIGITKNKKDFLFVYKILGIKKFFPNQNISRKYIVKNRKLTNKLINNELDVKLYKHALKLNKNFKRKSLVKILHSFFN
tara:strand:+ start:735 stop:1538 length:804 start_codon:yes stop_codon:yes gene_type:complete